MTNANIGVKYKFALTPPCLDATASNSHRMAYQIPKNNLAPVGFEKESTTREKPRLIAHIGINTASNGKKVSFPMGKENGIRCAPKNSQAAVRIGSVVFPVVLPAAAQANSEIKAKGNIVNATLLRA